MFSGISYLLHSKVEFINAHCYLPSGNHSSGKSSFINYVCQRKVQTAGVAPTDDGFTIIVPGPSDVDRDGNNNMVQSY